jgi:uncharacterized protein (TIGR03435 family)
MGVPKPSECSGVWTKRSVLIGIFSMFSLSVAVGQDEPARLVYDVVSIRPSPPGATGGIVPLPGGIGYNATATVKVILSVMYQIPLRQIVGGPDWLSNEKFDVRARTDRPSDTDDLHVMFQNALADRFGLKLHIETRIGPVYVLTIARSGLKMKPVDAGKDRNMPITDGRNNEAIGNRVHMDYLCYWLGQRLQNDERPVVNKTGLTGTYDFKLSFRPELPPDALANEQSPELEGLPTIFDAVKDQLGLQLIPQQGPVQTLVIDSVGKLSEN